MPGCPQSMGLLYRAPVLPGASRDPGGGSRSRGSSVPGDTINPLLAAPRHSDGCSLGWPCRRGPQQEVAVGLSSLTPQLPAWPAVLPREPAGGQQRWGWVPAPPGKGSEPQGASRTPQQSPTGAGSWAAGAFAEPDAPPAVPIALASCLWPRLGSGEPDVSSPSLSPRFLGGKLRPGSISQGRGEFPWKWERGSGLPAAGTGAC